MTNFAVKFEDPEYLRYQQNQKNSSPTVATSPVLIVQYRIKQVQKSVENCK